MAKFDMPDWYWSHGLHDARIVSATVKESDWDSTDNCLIFKIDCDGALFEADISEIRLYKFKALTLAFKLDDFNGGWWMSDEVVKKGDHYVIDLKFVTKKSKTRRVEIRFQKAEVIRASWSRMGLFMEI